MSSLDERSGRRVGELDLCGRRHHASDPIDTTAFGHDPFQSAGLTLQQIRGPCGCEMVLGYGQNLIAW